MEFIDYIFLVILGFLAGFINVFAGGGSMLVVPFLIFMGLPANVANATNRIAIILQNVVSVAGFKNNNVLEIKSDIRLLPPIILGCLVGAFAATDINEVLLKRIIAGLLVVMFFLVLLKPNVWIKSREAHKQNVWLRFLIFFAIGFYGGFIQIGVGFFLLAGLVLGCGFDLLKANALKVLLVLIYNIPALIIFIIYDIVDWRVGLILAIGNMSGAWLATRMSVRRGAGFVRYILLVALLVCAGKLFYDGF